MEYKKLTPQVDIVLGYESGKLVQVTIKAEHGAELGSDAIRYAVKQMQELARGSGPAKTAPIGSSISAMVAAYRDSDGRISDKYLASLAAAYADLAPYRRDVSTALALALGLPDPTLKGHLMRARRQGFLTKTDQGKRGGSITDKTKELLK